MSNGQQAVSTEQSEPLYRLSQPDDLEGVIKRIEIAMHRQGWDEAPNLGVIIDAEVPGARAHFQRTAERDRYTYSTPVVRVGRYMSLPLLPDRGLQPNFAVALHRLAINVSAAYDHPEIQRMLESTRHEGRVALVASYEAWMNADPEVCEAAKKKGVRFADIPSSKEIRHVYAIDVALQTWTVHRIRGEAPEVRREGGGGPDDKDAFTFRGSVPQDMHAFLMAILGEPVAELPNTPSLWDPAAERARGWKPQ